MYNENNAILKAKLEVKDSKILKKINGFYEGFYILFYLILKNPLDNFWWECISLTIQYSQLLIFIVDSTVSKKYYIIKIIVFANLESK
jgi:hypothetical protein